MSIRISYAQNREDVILDAFFSDLKEGFYVDVGANHPEHDSVTKYFYDKGWSGINIEPNKKLHNLLVQERPRDINLNIGVSDKPGKLKFREYINHGLSTFSGAMQEEYASNGEEKMGTYEEYEVNVFTLKRIFKDHKTKHINFLKIDVEGFEYEVLQGNDWKKDRPEVICIESNHIVKDWRPLLKKNGYNKIFFDGLNDYYVAKESQKLADTFSYPDDIVLGPPVVHVSAYNEIERAKNKYAFAKNESNRLRQHIDFLHEEMMRRQGIKYHTRALLSSIDKYISKRIDTLRSSKSKAHDELLNSTNIDSAQQLLRSTRQTDFIVFSDHIRSKQTIFKAVNATYNLFRSTAKSIIFGGAKTIRKVKGNKV